MKERKLGILGRKVGMTRVFKDDGTAMGVTVLELGPCPVLAKKTKGDRGNGKTDGYSALQLGYGDKPERKINKPEEGRLKAAGGNDKARRFVREVRVSDDDTLGKFEIGGEVTLADVDLKDGDLVDVSGTTQGKGFQGVFRRYDFRGFHATHAHEVFRHGGSIGCRKFPGRVFKGTRMAGRMGGKNRTTQNVKVVQVRAEENVLLVLGSVPGKKGATVLVRPAIKKNPTA